MAGRTTPDDAHAALADETRLRILSALADHYREAWSSGWLSFSELRDRVGVRDTSRFSYHLGKLRGEFIVKENEQYRPTIAALEIVSAVRAGTYGGETENREREIDEVCPRCERSLVARHRDHLLSLSCPDHGVALAYPVPPTAAAHRSLEELIDLALRRHAADVESIRRGVCPYCWGPASVSYPRETVPASYLRQDPVYATAACERCWLAYPIPIADLLVRFPPVVALYHDHGLGSPAAHLGSQALVSVSDVAVSDDPLSAQITVSLADDRLVVELDDDCTVREYRRT